MTKCLRLESELRIDRWILVISVRVIFAKLLERSDKILACDATAMCNKAIQFRPVRKRRDVREVVW